MDKRIAIAAALLCAVGRAASALPSTLAPDYMGTEVLIGYDFGMRSVRLDLGIYLGLLDDSMLPGADHFGFGFSFQLWTATNLVGMWLDGLYWWGPDSSGPGDVVVPIKLSLGGALQKRLFGVRVAAGLEDFALPLDSDTFVTLKALGEIDVWFNGEIDPLVMAGSAVDFHPPNPGPYSYTYY